MKHLVVEDVTTLSCRTSVRHLWTTRPTVCHSEGGRMPDRGSLTSQPCHSEECALHTTWKFRRREHGCQTGNCCAKERFSRRVHSTLLRMTRQWKQRRTDFSLVLEMSDPTCCRFVKDRNGSVEIIAFQNIANHLSPLRKSFANRSMPFVEFEIARVVL